MAISKCVLSKGTIVSKFEQFGGGGGAYLGIPGLTCMFL